MSAAAGTIVRKDRIPTPCAPKAAVANRRQQDHQASLVARVATPTFKESDSQKPIHFEDGRVYIGDVKNNRPHGVGWMTFEGVESENHPWGHYRYQGAFEDGLFHGLGLLTWNDGSHYQGAFARGEFDGKGMFVTSELTSVGIWKRGKMQGLGMCIWQNGERYQGEWLDDMRHGLGTLFSGNKQLYTGYWVKNEYIGERPLEKDKEASRSPSDKAMESEG